MNKRIALIQGHPDSDPKRFCRGLAASYLAGAQAGGHDVRRVEIADMDFPLLRTQHDYTSGSTPEAIKVAQETLLWAEHWVIIYPLWAGDLPALTKGFFEQILRPGFAFRYKEKGFPDKLLKGRSCRIIVTMGMPAIIYRLFYLSHGLQNFKRNILGLTGVNPIRSTLHGMIDQLSESKRIRILKDMEILGRDAK
jgi:putative NADPH-quinone reductase